MARTLLLLLMAVTCMVPDFVSADPTRAKALAVSAPKPDYPILPSGNRPEGSGMFLLHIDSKSGIVKSVSVDQSTGSPLLDKASIDCLRRWRFAPGAPKAKVPMTYTAHGLPPGWKI